ncbi:HlyD family secretion protein [Tenuifilum thalassicum]|uniref:HlyD family efflux transporter periplasmic adaptor subunit n=1 Tax=Tenuifilum thalassicum TaxID=2590900 RepID=A0A7D3XM32_9BACT|nr:efflux RND transporter periplasmic adaptor subunit [Tenuifilum thalassicum]QKG79916.1 HlyD family efflux transporter periplasmic adaptor subunit [Tenuifilum thalassicum]
MKRLNLFSIFFLSAIIISCGNNGNEADAYGNIESYDVTVSAEVGGKIIELKIDEGDKVAENQLIALVDTVQNSLKLQQLNAAKGAVLAKLQSIDAQIAVQNEQISVIERELNRVRRLYADSAATQRQLDEVEGKFRIAQKQLKAVEVQRSAVMSEVKSIDAQIAQVNDILLRSKVLSPIQGTVLTKFVNRGELIPTGRPICKIANLDTVYARVYIDETQLPEFKIGGKVKVFTDAANGELNMTEGEITWIASEAEFTPKIIQTRNERVNLVYAVKVKIPNPNGTLKVGMPVEVKL